MATRYRTFPAQVRAILPDGRRPLVECRSEDEAAKAYRWLLGQGATYVDAQWLGPYGYECDEIPGLPIVSANGQYATHLPTEVLRFPTKHGRRARASRP